MTWVLLFQKKEKKPHHLKPIYLSNYLNMMKQKIKQFKTTIIQNKIDQIIAKELYLKVINIIFQIHI